VQAHAPPPAPVDHVRDGASASTVLLDDAHTRIELFHRGGEGGTLVVTFDPLLYLWTRPPFGHEFLRKQALDVVAVRKKDENFYQPLSREAFEAAVRPVAERYARVVSYGSSLGAYAALYYGRDEPWTVIASSPRNSTHPVYGAKVWQQRARFEHQRFTPDVPPRCRAIIVYDPRDAIDRRYLEGEVLPQFAGAEVMRVPFAGHPANQVLAEMGFIAPFVRAVIAGRPRADYPVLDRREQRTRSHSYFQVLALACLQHRHLAWADALIARALALHATNMLVLRTLGMVRLAQQRWAEAVAPLEAALAASPDDPLTQSLLAKAAAGEPVPLPPRPSPVVAAPPAPRALQRLRARAAQWAQRLRRLTGRGG
jgi:hypothetical protein